MEFRAPDVLNIAGGSHSDFLLGATTNGTSLYNWRSGRLIRQWNVDCPFHSRLSAKTPEFIGQEHNGIVNFYPLDGNRPKRLGTDLWHATSFGVLSEDGSLAVTSSLNTGTIRWWSRPNAILLAECHQLSRLAVSPDARRVVNIDGDRQTRPMESIELLPGGRLSISRGPVVRTRCATFLNDDRYFAVADFNDVTRVFEFGTFREVATYADDHCGLFGLCYLPKTNRLLIHYEDRTLSWDLKTDGSVEDVPQVRHPSGFVVLNGGNRLAVYSRQWIRVFEV